MMCAPAESPDRMILDGETPCIKSCVRAEQASRSCVGYVLCGARAMSRLVGRSELQRNYAHNTRQRQRRRWRHLLSTTHSCGVLPGESDVRTIREECNRHLY